MGNFFRDAIEAIVDTAVQPRRCAATSRCGPPTRSTPARRASLARIPGVLQVEPGRRVAVRFIHGQRSETGAGRRARASPPELQRVIDVDGRQALAGRDGLLMSDRLADKLGLRAGDTVTVEMREGRRPGARRWWSSALVRDMMGLNAFMDAARAQPAAGRRRRRLRVHACAWSAARRRAVLEATQAPAARGGRVQQGHHAAQHGGGHAPATS